MAARLCRAQHAGSWCFGENEIRPREQQAANNGQRRFHELSIGLFSELR
jgi:hypothetical protein